MWQYWKTCWRRWHAGNVADFRMIIRGQQRTTHSDSETGFRTGEGTKRQRVLFPQVPPQWKQAIRRLGHSAGGHTETRTIISLHTRKIFARFRSGDMPSRGFGA